MISKYFSSIETTSLTIDSFSHLQRYAFLRYLQPFQTIFLSLILFLINRIGYPSRNKRFLQRTSRFDAQKTQDLDDRLD